MTVEAARRPVPIAPPADGVRPLWSVMIPAYECAAYLGSTLASVLAQDPGPDMMHVAVVDDHSTRDDLEPIVRAAGGTRVEFHRQPRNVGQVENFDTCLRLARGELVHLLHGDDEVRPGFYEAMAQPFEADPEAGAAICGYEVIDESGRAVHSAPLLQRSQGRLAGWLERMARGQLVQTPCVVVRRAVYEHLGGFDRRIGSYAEDWEMWVRIAAHYPVHYVPERLARYRIHADSVSGRAQRTGDNGRALRTAIAIVGESLPPHRAPAIQRAAARAAAHACARRARRFAKTGDAESASAQLREAVRFSRRPDVLGHAAASAAYITLLLPLLRMTRR